MNFIITIGLKCIGRKTYKINENLIINIPLVKHIRGDNAKDECDFWNEVNLFTLTPDDMMSELDSIGIDFEYISSYKLFIYLLTESQVRNKVSPYHKEWLFSNFNIYDLKLKQVTDTDIVLVDDNGTEIINEGVYNELSDIIAEITGIKKTPKKKFGNDFTKKMRIKYDYINKEKKRQQNNKSQYDILSGIILRLVCNANFPYDFETVQDVTICDLMYSLKQIDKDIQVTDLMQTRLVGNDLSKIPMENLSRFVS